MTAASNEKIYPPSWIGIVGGGQLGRMLAQVAKRMGYKVLILDPNPNGPAAQVSDDQIVAPYDDWDALQAFAQRVSVITFEFEHISAHALIELESLGHTVIPSGKTLNWIQHKGKQKEKLAAKGLPVPKFYPINSLETLKKHLEDLGGKAVLKRCTEGYDGKGNAVITPEDNLETIYHTFSNTPLILEAWVPFVKEISILVAVSSQEMDSSQDVDSSQGVVTYYPIAENLHTNSILVHSTVPARLTPQEEEAVLATARGVVDLIQDKGLYCIELFLDAQGQVYINEIAPRPHNSGHYTIEATITSQYEQLLRIITGMPLGATTLTSPCAMYNILGPEQVLGTYEVQGIDQCLKMPQSHLHLYGKASTGPQKKIGHITALAPTVQEALEKVRLAHEALKIRRHQ